MSKALEGYLFTLILMVGAATMGWTAFYFLHPSLHSITPPVENYVRPYTSPMHDCLCECDGEFFFQPGVRDMTPKGGIHSNHASCAACLVVNAAHEA